jgi:hypothetical protein
MSSTSIVASPVASEASEGTITLENACSPTDMQATDAQVRLAAARARREYDVTLRTNPRTIEHIRQLIALECGRVDGPCEDCPGRSHPLCCWNWDDRFPSAGGAA